MTPTLHNILSERNSHPRDSHIKFFEEDHRYEIDIDPDTKYTSTTTYIHEHFNKFDADKIIEKMMSGKGWVPGHKYWGLTPEQIKEQWDSNRETASGSGTDLHFAIECFNNEPKLDAGYTNADLLRVYEPQPDPSIEWQYFINFITDHPDLKPYRTEWTVFNEDLKISGSIDMVYENSDGTLSIYDWKRSKGITRVNQYNQFSITPCICHLHDTNFWHYALQLNIYKYILETKYDKIIKDLYLVRLHPDAEENNYELIKLPILKREITDLFAERIKNINV